MKYTIEATNVQTQHTETFVRYTYGETIVLITDLLLAGIKVSAIMQPEPNRSTNDQTSETDED